MLEITKYFIDAIKSDSNFISWMGIDINDSRIYADDIPMTVIFSSVKKAAIYYRESQVPRPFLFSYPSQKGNIYYYFSVVSSDKTLVKAISEALVKKFENRGFNTTNYKVGNTVANGSSDSAGEGTPTTPMFKRTVTFMLSEVFDRTTTYPT